VCVCVYFGQTTSSIDTPWNMEAKMRRQY